MRAGSESSSRPSWRSWMQQALGEVARARRPGGSKLLDARAARARRSSMSGQTLARNAISSTRQREVAVLVEVADDQRADLLLGVGEVGEPELPDQVVGERACAGRACSRAPAAGRRRRPRPRRRRRRRACRCGSSRRTPSSRSRSMVDACGDVAAAARLGAATRSVPRLAVDGRHLGLGSSAFSSAVLLEHRILASAPRRSSVSSSARDTWRILIACRSWGVITSCCVSRAAVEPGLGHHADRSYYRRNFSPR